MLRFWTGAGSGHTLSRREWLRIGGAASIELALAQRLTLAAPSSPAARVPGFGRAKSVIVVYASGGQSQLETWDPKPEAPAEVRGEFGAIPTSVPGTFISEHMPRLAKLANRYAIVRSVSHDDFDHGSASYLALTGHFHPNKTSNPPPQPTDLPTYGAVVKRVKPNTRFPFDAVHINGPALVPETIAPGQDGGLLGTAFEPLLLGDVSSTPVAVPSLSPLPDLPGLRLESRRGLKSVLEQAGVDLPNARLPDGHFRDMDFAYQQAFHLLASPQYHKAFDLQSESPAVRDRYGRNRPGQACLLARRLVEAGVPLITVIWSHSNRGQDKEPDVTEAYGWDTHNDIFDALKVRLLPRFDQGFSALLEDLEQRGLLDETLVICMGEFGRAPLVALEKRFAGSSPGRKHWASVYSVVLAGAGITPGAVYGASDRLAAQPLADRVSPCDISATLFSALGIDPEGHFEDSFSRPFPITTGRPIEGLYR